MTTVEEAEALARVHAGQEWRPKVCPYDRRTKEGRAYLRAYAAEERRLRETPDDRP